jgi:hypothetical protein
MEWIAIIILFLFFIGKLLLIFTPDSVEEKIKKGTTLTKEEIKEEAKTIAANVKTIKQFKALEKRLEKANNRRYGDLSGTSSQKASTQCAILDTAFDLAADNTLAWQFIPELELYTQKGTLLNGYKVFSTNDYNQKIDKKDFKEGFWERIRGWDDEFEKDPMLPHLIKFRTIIESEDTKENQKAKINKLCKSYKGFSNYYFDSDSEQSPGTQWFDDEDLTDESVDGQAPIKEKNSPEKQLLLKVFDKHLDLIKVLFYVGKADGQLRKPEREIICKTIRSIAKNKDILDDDINKAINQLSVPSMQTFKLAFGKLCEKYPKQVHQIYAVAKQIVDTQKNIHAHETEALGYMTKKMKKENISFN